MKNYLDCKKNWNKEQLKEPAKILKNGGIVVFPTETVYAIGTNGLNEEAVKRLYKTKQRPSTKPMSLLVSDIEMVKKITKNISEKEYQLMEKFFPGPFTLVLKKNNMIPDTLTAGKETVGVRMPDNAIAIELIKMAGVPIAAPSANISDKPSGTNIEMIWEDFKDKVDYWIDGGKSKIGIPSTIVQVINDEVCILREGNISKGAIISGLKIV